MGELSISLENRTLLANELKNIYFLSTVTKQHSDNSELLRNINVLVDANIQNQREIFNANPEVSYCISNHNELIEAFLEKYSEVVEKAERFANSINTITGYGIDLVNVLCPFILYNLGITDASTSFYIGLGLVIAKIICDSLANKAKKKEEQLEKIQIKELEETCSKMLHYIENNCGNDSTKNVSDIKDSLSSVCNILETKEDETRNSRSE